MTTNKISPKTEERVNLLFSKENRAEAVRLLIEEGGNNLPFLENHDEYQLERIRFAILKLSDGKLPDLKEAIALAKTDWRDLLMAAGFGHDIKAHQNWLPDTRA